MVQCGAELFCRGVPVSIFILLYLLTTRHPITLLQNGVKGIGMQMPATTLNQLLTVIALLKPINQTKNLYQYEHYSGLYKMEVDD